MPYPLPVYDQLYAISDIHLGGRKTETQNFQIFHRGPRLAGFIDQVRDAGGEAREAIDVVLVLNGDLIDSLAEDEVTGYAALDERTALSMIDRLWQDESFAMVWQALAAFVQTPGRHLVVIVGNHDIELALPIVQADLRRRLCGDDPLTRTRLVFATDGAGYTCRVGKARVFCTHGNEVDPMNWVDYNQLGQVANAINAGRTPDIAKWRPNGGTRLVRDVMNTVKKTYPFVDLLKPENAAVGAVLAAIDRATFSRIDLRDAFPIGRAALRGTRVTDDLMGGDEGTGGDGPAIAATPAGTAETVLGEVLGPRLREAVAQSRGAARSAEDELLLQAAAAGDAAVAGHLAAGNGPDAEVLETLGAGDLIGGLLGLLPKHEALRRALQDWIDEDKTFDVAAETHDGGLFAAMCNRVGVGVDFTITGHTHLARALRFDDGRWYYNCGTWIRLLRLTTQVLDSADAYREQLWPVLTEGTLEALDRALILGPGAAQVPLLADLTHAVRIVRDGGSVKGDLLRVGGLERAEVTLDVEPGTRTAVCR